MSKKPSQKKSRLSPTPAAASADVQKALAPLRKQIDELDKKVIELLNDRARVVIQIGNIKRGDHAPIYAADREHRVLEQIRKHNKGPLPNACLEAMWRELMSGGLMLEHPLRVGYLGPAGSFSHLAARRKFGASVEYDSLEDIAGVFKEVSRGHIDLGLVPIENSSMGGIGETLDSFLEYPVKVCAEVLINIHHNLLSNSLPEKITKIYSKPEIFSQCREWLSVQLKEAERIPVASSSKAAEIAQHEPGSAAIGSALAGELYNLKTIFENIEDNPNNITRFFVIGRQESQPTGQDKTAIMFTTAHKPGSLASVIDVFRDCGLNLTHIDKRPSKRVNWEYYFFIDCQGHISDANVAKAVEAAKVHCLQLTVLGSFPMAKDVL